MRLIEIAHPETIMSATDNNGHVNRNKANKMVDPRGYFAKNKRRIKRKNILSKVS
jgi:hypothetical protein